MVSRRALLLLPLAAILGRAAETPLEGKWVWRRVDRARSTQFREFPATTEFEFHKQGKNYTGHIASQYPAVDEELRAIEWDGKNLAFTTGKPGGAGTEALTKWTGTLSGDTIKGTYTYVESRAYGNFEMTRVE